jgi:DNA repair protein RecO (recombination protein O)
MPSYQTTALVLKKTKLGETDLIITLIDEEGLQRRAVAKGARKPGSFMAARLELYMLVEVHLSKGRSLDIVTDARILEAHVGCRSDLEHSAAAAVPLELVEKATSHHNAEPLLYAMSLAALEQIGEATGNAPALIALACVLKLCAALGVRPDAQELTTTDESLATWVETLLQARFVDLLTFSDDEYLPILRKLAQFCSQWAAEHLDLKLKSLGLLESLLKTSSVQK